VNGKLEAEGEALVFTEITGGSIKVRLSSRDRPQARGMTGKAMLLGIRPEHIELAQFTGTEDRTASFPAIIDMVEPMGPETNLYLQTGAHTVVCRSQRPVEHREVGHRLQFELKLVEAHLFEPTSGNRVF
jgi:multiple sugar transport system ATP-binding protein